MLCFIVKNQVYEMDKKDMVFFLGYYIGVWVINEKLKDNGINFKKELCNKCIGV